ncbi:MAG TPA: hypothetical protein VFP50_19940 [Anaeromyxobacteraceae bacterium]|nr:hypothetical protein [Anaeromyxobacteraceae bacterium]
MVLQAGGVPFVVEAHLRHLVPGLRIELQRVFGREGLIAFNDGQGGGGC